VLLNADRHGDPWIAAVVAMASVRSLPADLRGHPEPASLFPDQRLGEAINGDGPDRDRRCDRKRDLQIEGTGSSPQDVVIERRGFGDPGPLLDPAMTHRLPLAPT
jgi:hypothetical protein